jgi:hypothetical protein
MKRVRLLAALAAFGIPALPAAGADAAAGIAVDGQGAVYFTDGSQGSWKIDNGGRVRPQEGPPANYLTLDPEGRFAGARAPEGLPGFHPAGRRPTLIYSGDVPAAMGRDGALYFPQPGADGRLRIVRQLPSGSHSVLATLPATSENGPLESINGIAVGPDGSVYYTENKAVRRIGPEGAIGTLATSLEVPDCTRPPGADEKLGPQLRGIDVAPDGAVYVAAAGCGATIKVSGAGEVTPVLRTSGRWTPKGVAARERDLYVLETSGEAAAPRVRRLSGDGRVSLLAENPRR